MITGSNRLSEFYLYLLQWIRVVRVSPELELAARFRQPVAVAPQAAVVEALKHDGGQISCHPFAIGIHNLERCYY